MNEYYDKKNQPPSTIRFSYTQGNTNYHWDKTNETALLLFLPRQPEFIILRQNIAFAELNYAPLCTFRTHELWAADIHWLLLLLLAPVTISLDPTGKWLWRNIIAIRCSIQCSLCINRKRDRQSGPSTANAKSTLTSADFLLYPTTIRFILGEQLAH